MTWIPTNNLFLSFLHFLSFLYLLYLLSFLSLDERHPSLLTFFSHIFRPDTSLNLADVRLVEQHHTETALTDTTTDTQWQLVVQELLVEIELLSIFLAFQLQLAKQALLINTDTHGRKLQSDIQNRIINDDITVQLPVL